MRRNCNLELQLLPSAYYNNNSNNNIGEQESSGYTDSDQLSQRRRAMIMEESARNGIIISPKQNQPLTIFYNGKICVCDVDEFQAKAILLLANREVDERVKTPMTTKTAMILSSPSVRSPVYSPVASLSMKKSLQSFLHKRKHRAQAMTPYHR